MSEAGLQTGDWANAAHRQYGVFRRAGGALSASLEAVAEEVPVALVYNGIAHAVMLATPQDLEDFACGFSLAECIVERAGEIHDIDLIEQAEGIELRIEIATPRALALREHRRTLAGRTGCGLCGTESLRQLRRPPASVSSAAALSAAALEAAQAGLHELQQIHRATGAVHAAAWCDFSGDIALLREDVGRHNALDKLIGARARARQSFADGFVLLTSRASYEMVQKAAAVGIAVVAAVSAPTGMAVRLAEAAGMTLVGFARGDRHCIYAHPERVH